MSLKITIQDMENVVKRYLKHIMTRIGKYPSTKLK